MKQALLLLRKETHYRSDAFIAGLHALGYKVIDEESKTHAIGPETLLVLWNRKAGREDKLATSYERCGARVMVAENGYIGADENGHQMYALALGGHNGSGKWHVGIEDRWSKLGIEIKPWAERNDGYLLICGQRGIGSPTMASPVGWHLKVHDAIKARGTPWALRTRNHPGENAPRTPLEEDLAGAMGCLIWSSGSGVKALVAGIPVCYAAPHWICESAAMRYNAREHIASFSISKDRLLALRRMAWAQWSLGEIASGEAFGALLNRELNS